MTELLGGGIAWVDKASGGGGWGLGALLEAGGSGRGPAENLLPFFEHLSF